MNEKWSELNIEDWFVDVHHFSLSQSENPSPSIEIFVSYCDKGILKVRMLVQLKGD